MSRTARGLRVLVLLTDLVDLLSEFNLELQAEDKFVINMISRVNRFKSNTFWIKVFSGVKCFFSHENHEVKVQIHNDG